MRRILAFSAILAVAALSGGCSSLHDRGSSTSTNSNTATTGAAPKSAPASSAPAVGGAQPQQAKPSPTSEAGIKPPTKNQH
ncbi:MAG TPA: hypothetical protein VF735_19055 [Pyrinomonadaceae bacterium]|jgi:hypothetical protein